MANNESAAKIFLDNAFLGSKRIGAYFFQAGTSEDSESSAMIADNVLIVTGSCTASISENILRITGNNSAEISGGVLSVK